MISVAEGGNFQSGFLAAGVSTLASPFYATNNAVAGMEETVVGGASSVLGGGKFANGAVTAAFSFVFNHMGHLCEEEGFCPPEEGQTRGEPGNEYVRQIIPGGGNPETAALDSAGIEYGGAVGAAAEGEAFHYTFSGRVSSIETNGLFAGSYLTNTGELSPLQAHIDLALPPNRGLPDTLLRIDLNGLQGAGYDIPGFMQVGQMYNMPGGGMEMQVPYDIPPEFISVVK